MIPILLLTGQRDADKWDHEQDQDHEQEGTKRRDFRDADLHVRHRD
jgi:hypothetical protein